VCAWVIAGIKGEKLTLKKNTVHSVLRTGTIPVGVSAAVATIFLVIVFLLN